MISTDTVLGNKPLRVNVVSEVAQLERLRPAWRDLLERSASDEPMLSPTWLIEWWRVFGPLNARQLRVVLFYESERLVGLAPLLRRRHWHRPGIPFRRLEPLGSGEPETDRVWSEYLSVVAEPRLEDQVACRLAEAVVSGMLGDWDEIVFPCMDGENQFATRLLEA